MQVENAKQIMYLVLIIGHTGQGKSEFLNKTFLNNVIRKSPSNQNKNLYHQNNASNMQYVFDVNNEYMLPDDKGHLYSKCRHIDCDIKKFISNCKQIRNSNIVIEDATGFLRGKQFKEFAQLLAAKIHQQNNYIILFHSINRVPPELMEMANYVVLFKTVDNEDVINKKFKNLRLTKAFLRLKSKPDFSNETIKLI